MQIFMFPKQNLGRKWLKLESAPPPYLFLYTVYSAWCELVFVVLSKGPAKQNRQELGFFAPFFSFSCCMGSMEKKKMWSSLAMIYDYI